MQPVKSQLTFQTYQVEKMIFNLNDNYACVDDNLVELKPKFSREIRKFEDDKYELLLGVFIKQDNEDEVLPFSLEVVVKGCFLLKGVEDQEERMKINATAILFPYVRATVSLLMSLANIEPLFLPAMNIARMLEEQEKIIHSETSER